MEGVGVEWLLLRWRRERRVRGMVEEGVDVVEGEKGERNGGEGSHDGRSLG